MKKCANCGGDNPNDAKFCRFCGTPFHDEAMTKSTPATSPTPAVSAQPEVVSPSTSSMQAKTDSQNMTTTVDTTAESAEQTATQQAATQQMAATPAPVISTPPHQNSAQQTIPVATQPAVPQQSVSPAQYVPAQQVSQIPVGQPTAQPMQQNLGQAAPQYAPATNDVPATNTPSTGKEFGEWLLGSLKKPSEMMKSQTWYGFVSTFGTAFIMALFVFSLENSLANVVSSGANSVMHMFSSSANYSSSISVSVLFKAWFVFSAIIYLIILATFIGKRFFGDPQSFIELQTSIGQRLIPFACIYAVLLLLTFIGAGALAAFLFFMLVVMMWQFIPFELGSAQFNRKADKFWVWFGSLALSGVFVFVTIFLIAWLMAGSASGYQQSWEFF